MTIQQLIYFTGIVEHGTYSKAADVLYVSQPALSYAIKELERELQVPLFQKDGRAARLTRYGELFYRHAGNILQELEAARQNIDALVNPNHGRVVISHISSMNATFIPDIIRAFYRTPAHRNIKFSFTENPTRAVAEDILSGRSDIGFGSKPEDPAISHFPVYWEELVAIVHKEHPLAARDHVELEEIAQHDFVAYDKQCGIRADIDSLFLARGIRQNILCEVVDNIMVAGLVSAGMGMAIVPRMYSGEQYNVKALSIRNAPARRMLYLLWDESQFLSPAVKNFLGFVREFAGQYREAAAEGRAKS